jgi:DNA mismatch repair protein MutL
MARVHLLDDELINKIAAGEVVERPASVVKELVENAIDAGSQQIRVSLKDGGRQLIEISDDGLGMSPEDAVLALKRHTTSKLRSADDLFEVSTMGFRGEALASISSVSRFTLQTMSRDFKEGIRVTHEDGQTQSFPWQGSFGTSVTIKDLFYNVPARKSFMKTSAAEFAVCHEYLQALALALPQLGFRLLHNDKEIFSVSPLPVPDGWARGEQALRLRTQALLGEELASKLIYIQHQDRHLRLEALISPPGLDKGTAKHIFTFVNNRWVKDKLLRYGVLRGYHSHILRGKFPVVLMHVDMDAALVDVNVHPAKTELRFQYGTEVQASIAMAIRDGLRQGAWGSSKSNPTTAFSESYTPAEQAPGRQSASASAQPKAASTQNVPDDFDLILPKYAETEAINKEEIASFAATALREARGSSTELDLSSSKASETGSSGIKRTTMSFDTPAQVSSRNSFSAGEKKPSSSPLYPHYPKADPSFEKKSDGKFQASVSKPTVSSAYPAPKPRAAAEAPAPISVEAHKAVPLASVGAPMMPRIPAPTAIPMMPKADLGIFDSKEIARPSKAETDIPWDELKFVGAFQRCFLFFEHSDQLLVVDQHAFHERILYERLLQNPSLLKRTQPLLMPEVLDFSPEECVEFAEKATELKALGFDFELISPKEIEVRAIPALLVNKDIQAAFTSLLNGKKDHQEIFHDVLASVACHAAVRAGEELPEPELKQLLAEAKTVDFFLNCPHGRRVLRWWKASQVAGWFDRLG